MRDLILLFSAAISLAATAQTTAPVQQDAKTHVTAGQSATATNQAARASLTQKQDSRPPEGKPVVLDSVVAIVNGDVLLESDVEQERRFESLQLLPASENTDAHAAAHLITRTLILQQMKEEDQTSPNITEADVDKFLAELKKQLPGCLPTRCESEAGWNAYLEQRGLSAKEVAERWRERLIILDYLNQRFRAGVRIPEDQVQAYYQTNLVPQFLAKHEKAPTLKSLQPRIENVLLEQQVSKQIDDWEATLRQQGSVQILVPAYGESSAKAAVEDDLPGGAL